MESAEANAPYLSRRFEPMEESLVLISSSVASSGNSDRRPRLIELPELFVGVGEAAMNGVVAAARARSIDGSIGLAVDVDGEGLTGYAGLEWN